MAKPVQGPKERQKQEHTEDSLSKTLFEKQTHPLQNPGYQYLSFQKHQVNFVHLSHLYGRIHLSSSELEFVSGPEG